MEQTQVTLEGETALDYKIRQSTEIIRRTVEQSKDAPLIINFSGGKDSLTLLDLTQRVTSNFVCFYMTSGIEFQEGIDFATAQCAQLGVKLLTSHPSDYKGGFFERLRVIGYFPTVQNNTLWCNRDLKIRPQQVILRRVFGNRTFYKLNGVRRFESARRKKIHRNTRDFMRADYHVAKGVMVFPILNWTDDDVRGYLRQNSVRVNKNPLYDKYGVSGCYWCPFYQPSIYKRILQAHPNLYDRFIEVESALGSPSVSGHVFLRDLKSAVLEGCACSKAL